MAQTPRYKVGIAESVRKKTFGLRHSWPCYKLSIPEAIGVLPAVQRIPLNTPAPLCYVFFTFL